MKTVIFCILVSAFQINNSIGANIKFQINHWNDVGSQLEGFRVPDDPTQGECITNKPPCYGGLGGLINVTDTKDQSVLVENFLRLTSGNLVGGESGWLSLVGWEEFGNLIKDHYKPHAMSLGINDFGATLSQTVNYLKAANKTADNVPKTVTVISNIKQCGGGTAENEFCKFIVQEAIMPLKAEDTANVNIGLVGFVNPDVVKLGSPGLLQFDDVITGLNGPVNKLRAQNVNFIIALGDGSLETAQKIIDSYPQIKLVIYGRGFGAAKNMTGKYPEPYKSSYIATAGRYGASVGKLIVEFDSANGNIKSVSGSALVPIDEKIDPVRAVTDTIHTKFLPNITIAQNEKLGRTHVTIHGGEICWTNECNLGNIMADAAVHCAFQQDGSQYNIPEGNLLGIWHGGAFFYDKVKQKENVTAYDVHRWLPFHNNVHLVALKGSSLKALFDASATALDDDTSRQKKWGQFLQVSNGMEVTYSKSGGKGLVERIRVVQETDAMPTMKEIVNEDRYLLVMPSFLREGRSIFDFVKNDGFFMKLENTTNGYFSLGFDDDCLQNYIKGLGGLVTGFEERIFTDSRPTPSCPKCKNNTAKHVLLTLFLTLAILGGIFVGWKFLWPRFSNRNHSSFS